MDHSEGGSSKIDAELATLSENLLAGVVGPTIMSMIASREAERATITSHIAATANPVEMDILPHPVLVRRLEEKIAGLREALNDGAVRPEAATTIRSLIECLTIHSVPADGSVEAEVSALVGSLVGYAQDAENPRRGCDGGGSVAVVAGTCSQLSLLISSQWQVPRQL